MMMNSNENTTTTTRLSILKSFNNKEEDIQQQQQQQSQQTQSSSNHRNHSILTRNLRLNNGHQSQLLNSPQKISIINNLQHSTTTNHNLTSSSSSTIINNKTGFTDLSFIDFSCINFPRIAQNYCELWPRKVSLNSPLHNYTCNKCSHSFPCPSSLKLHSENDVNCRLLLNNLNKIVYKTIDDLIKQIEYETEFENDDNKISYLKQFGLIEKEELKRKEDKRLKLREKLIDINYQFIIDLDKWKLQQHQATYKVLLKPNVNLNRPLLIRSKKIKRIKSFAYLKQQQQQQQLNNKDDEQQQSSTYRIVRIARSNSTSSSSTTTQQNENNKRPIINNNNNNNSINSKRVKRQQQQQDQQKPTTNVDSISFKKILTISNELILNKNKSPPSLPPPPPTLFKLTDQQNNNKKVFEMPKLQPISSLSTTTTTNNKQQQQPKLKAPQQQTIINENVSLKCKFCPNIFKGKSKFLQHFINAHPELIRERFNRHQQNTSSSSTTSGIKVKVN
jgi:hypothetical protein